MEDPFKPLSLSIKELFGNIDSLYKIPQYQRPYKWEDEQIDKLWDDMYEAFENDDENYFLGSVITAKPRDDEKSNYVDVVDGQQRLTTLMIMFCVLRDLYPNINADIDSTDQTAVDIDTIEASITMNRKSTRLKFYTHSHHQSDFENLILNGETQKLKKPFKNQIRQDEEPKFKFINSAVLIRQHFEALDEKVASEFVSFIFNKVKIIRIDCKDREFAIKLFQVLNDRGMDLTAADLIKSYLLGNLHKKYGDDKETSKIKEEQFVADWRDMEQTIKSCDINLNDLFIIYEYYILGQNPKKSLYDELQYAFKNKDPNVLIDDIKKFTNTYFEKIWNAEDKVIYSLRYIRWNIYWKTILLTALHTNYESYEELKKHLRRFYYLYWIAGKTLSQIKQTSFNLIKWVKDNKPITEIIDELNRKIESDSIIEQATRNLISEHIAEEIWCKPLLIMMEYNSTDDSKSSYIELNQDLHLEHIMPVKHEKFEEWNHVTKDVAAKWLNSAGNITLLSGTKNIEASNNPFDMKIDVYKGKGKYENKNEKISAFQITQAIVNDYELNVYGKKWTLDAMQKRWEWFFKEAQEILHINLEDVIQRHQPEII